jgi:hypothetical protein
VVLFADDLDKLSTAGEVEAHAFSLVDRLNGALFVRDPRRQPIKMSGALERTPQSSAGAVVYQHQHVLRGEVRGFRVRIGGTLSVGTTGDSLTPTPAPRERNWIDASLRDEAVADALAFLRGDPGWFDLYKAFEVMDVDVQHRCEQGWQRAAIGWPSKTAIKRFTQSAQPHRHSRPAVRQTPKGGWMPLDEAKPFVARLFVAWTDWRAQKSPPAGHSAT